MVIESNVLPRNQYGKSNHLILPWYFRTMSKGKSPVNMSLFEEDVNKSVKYPFPKNELVTKMRTSFPSHQQHFRMCSTFCRRPDCHQDSLIPQIMSEFDYKFYCKLVVRPSIPAKRSGSYGYLDSKVFPSRLCGVYIKQHLLLVCLLPKRHSFSPNDKLIKNKRSCSM